MNVAELVELKNAHLSSANQFSAFGDDINAAEQLNVALAIECEHPEAFEVTPLPTRMMVNYLNTHGMRIVRRAEGFRIGVAPVFDGGDAA